MENPLKNLLSGLGGGNPSEVQNKQKLVKLVGSVILGGVLLVFMFSGNDHQGPVDKPGGINILSDDEAAQSGYVGKVAPQVSSIVEQNKDLMVKDKELKGQIEEMKKSIDDLKKGGGAPGESILPFPPAPAARGNEAAQMLGMVPGTVPPLPPSAIQAPKRTVEKNDEIKDSLAVEEVKRDASVKKNDDLSGKLKSGIGAKKPFLPTGAITKAKLLNGLYAPTMTKAKSNPLPVLMRMTDLSIIPNRKRFNIKECFILGEAFGELSSERVHIRLTNISCVTSKNEIIDVAVKGFVAGEDGRTGLAGKVVSKQGAMIGRTIIAGFLQGVGQSLSQANQQVMTSPLGTTTSATSLSPETVAKTGAYAGGAKAAEKLADFYLKMADSIEPVIEVAGGRTVEVVITQGVELETKEELRQAQKSQQQAQQDTAPIPENLTPNNQNK